MSRAVSSIVATVAIAGAIAIGVVGYRAWVRSHANTTMSQDMAAPASNATSDNATPRAMPRGPITIDPRRQQLIGVRIVSVTRGPLAETVRAVGTVQYDETRQVDVNVRVDGWIRDLYVDSTGQAVAAGQRLFALYSPDLLTTQQEYLLALQARDQLQGSSIADARERAERMVAAARQRLTLWDLAPEDLRALDEQHKTTDAITFRSPSSGVVVEKSAVKGQHVSAGQTLYKLADLSTVWVEASVYENEIAGIRLGADAAITVDAYPGERFTGRVAYVYPYLDPATRTNKVRFALANPSGRLKPGMFANVEVALAAAVGLTLPADAVLDSGTEQIVFIAEGDGVFTPRHVKVGRRLGENVQIVDGVAEGERVATGAAFFLDSESQLRASLQSYEPAQASGGAAPATQGADITLRTIPEPAKTGDNQFEATVKDAGGKPIDDAQVSVEFFMAAMPTMNMPAMRNEAKLSPAGNGVYRGTGQIMMSGRWDATVTATRGGQRLGRKQIAVVAQ
jgi:RND family efflux transporter MFP subunit